MSVMDFAPPTAPAASDKPRREFLTCTLGEETYGIDLLKVQEIREIDGVTRVPRVAPYVRGVINLRGAIVPVVDLGMLFGFGQPLPLAKASAIVLNVDRRLTGLIVEGVSDVLALADEQIEPAPELGGVSVGAAIMGIGSLPEAGQSQAGVLILDIDYVLRRVRGEGA